MSADILLRADESQNDETFKTYFMKHIVIFKHTAVTIKNDDYYKIENDYEFDDFSKAYKLYQDKIKEFAEHIGTLSATKLETSLKLVSKSNDGVTKCHYRMYMSN